MAKTDRALVIVLIIVGILFANSQGIINIPGLQSAADVDKTDDGVTGVLCLHDGAVMTVGPTMVRYAPTTDVSSEYHRVFIDGLDRGLKVDGTTMDVKREILYNFWETLPPLKTIPKAEDDVYGHKVRLQIIKLLRNGIIDESEEKRRRRALNAREILSILKELKIKDEEGGSKTKKISLQSLYFHLQKLEEAELIQTVTILRKGSHNTAYYGRTARIYLHMDNVKHKKKISKAFSAIKKFAMIENPELN